MIRQHFLMETSASNSYNKYNKNVSQNALLCFQHGGGGRLCSRSDRYNYMETQDTQLLYEPHRVVFHTTDSTIWKPGFSRNIKFNIPKYQCSFTLITPFSTTMCNLGGVTFRSPLSIFEYLTTKRRYDCMK